jgi:hypothetical protein
MYAVIRLDEHGVEVERVDDITIIGRAVRLYYRTLRRHRGAHVRLIRSGNLPGTDPQVVAERFGL